MCEKFCGCGMPCIKETAHKVHGCSVHYPEPEPFPDLAPEVVSELSPGVRTAVSWLRRHRFDTVDSGDGSNHAKGMECAVEFPHVVIRCEGYMLEEADRLEQLIASQGIRTVASGDGHEPLDCLQVEATYWPGSGTMLLTISEFGESGLMERLGQVGD